MPKLAKLLLISLFLTQSAFADDITENSRFSLGAGLGITEFDSTYRTQPTTDIALRGEWHPWNLLSFALGGSHSAPSGDRWRTNEVKLFGHAQIHPFRTAPSAKGWDPYFLLGASEIFRSTHFDFEDATYRRNGTQWNAGVGTSFLFTTKLGAWMEAVAGRETGRQRIQYGTSFTGHVGIRYFL